MPLPKNKKLLLFFPLFLLFFYILNSPVFAQTPVPMIWGVDSSGFFVKERSTGNVKMRIDNDGNLDAPFKSNPSTVNKLSNPGFESDVDGDGVPNNWFKNFAITSTCTYALEYNSTNLGEGYRSVKMTAATTGDICSLASDLFPVFPGKTYTASAFAKDDGTNHNNFSVELCLFANDATNYSYTSPGCIDNKITLINAATTTSSYTQKTGSEITIPTGLTKGRLVIKHAPAATNAVRYIDTAEFKEVGMDLPLAAANLSSGTFGAARGYGNYTFTKADTTPILRIDATGGLVGIGTTVPAQKLDVVGVGNFTGTPNSSWIGSVTGVNSTSAQGLIGGQVDGTYWTGVAGKATPANGIGVYGIATNATGFGGYFTNSGGGPALITNAGNVGIGTTGPGAPLAINQAVTGATNTIYGQMMLQNYTTAGSTTADYKTGFYVGKTSYNIPDTYTSSGYQIALNASNYISDTNFAGTISDLRSIWARVGIYTAAAAGARTVTNAYGVYIENLANAGTITNNYGLYQLTSAAKNYFAGNVGIATTGPQQKLDVAGTALVQNLTATGTTGVTLSGAGADLNFSDTGASPNTITTSGTSHLGLLPAGNVGIGTTGPAQKLDVVGKIRVSTQGAAAGEVITAGRSLTAGSGLTGGGDLTADRTFTVGAGTCITVNASDVAVTTTGCKTNWDLAFSHISADGSSHSFINQSVTTAASPTFVGYNLGNSTTYFRAGLNSADWRGWIGLNATWTAANSWNYVATGGYGGTAAMMDMLSGAIRFHTASGGVDPITWNERVTITNAGSVGIGTTGPAQKLDVVGKIRASTQGAAAGEVITAGRSLTAGSGLTGGGDLTADRTFTVGAGTCVTVNASDVAVTTTGCKTNWDLAFSHISADGSSHSFINQSVTTAASPTFAGLTVSGTAAADYYNVTAGDGYGLRFWSSDNYKIHMGTAAEYIYGPVTNYSIKTNMNSTAGRGWTWGQPGIAPIAAISNTGSMQVAGNFVSMGSVGIGTTVPATKLDVAGVVTATSGNSTNWNSAFSHISADGSSHSFINQSVTTAASPTFVRLTLSQATGTSPLAVTSTTVVTNLNADWLDGISSGSFLRNDADDTFTGKLSVGSTSTRQAGIYGIYDSTKIGHIWSMGTGYPIAADGSTFGTLYGMAYCHTNNANCKAGYGHQIDITSAGTVGIALGMTGSAWFAGSITAGTYIDAGTQFLGRDADTVTAPSFSWTSDTNTGMWAPAADNLAFTTGGAEAMRVTSGNNVGIGTTAPGAKLDVVGTGNVSSTLSVGQLNVDGIYTLNTSAAYLYLADGNFASGIYMRANLKPADGYDIIPYTTLGSNLGDTTHYWGTSYINNGYFSGSVGIGTTAPGYNLDIVGNLRLQNTETNANSTTYNIYQYVNTSGSTALTAARSYAGMYNRLDTNYTSTNATWAKNAYGILSYVYNGITGNNSPMTGITGIYNYVRNDNTSGTVGTIYGDYNYVRNYGNGVNAAAVTTAFGSYNYIRQDNYAGGSIDTGYLVYGGYSDAGGLITTRYGVYMAGEVVNYFSGSVGLGTTGPAQKLDVVGKIRASTQGAAAGEVITAGRSLTAGNGLSGGGDLTADRTFTVGAGTCVTVAATTVGVTADCIGDTQLAYNTGQHLTTASSPTFVNLTATGTTGLTLSGAGADLLFSNTGGTANTISTSGNSVLAIMTGTGSVGIGTTGPAYKLDVVGQINSTSLRGGSSYAYFIDGAADGVYYRGGSGMPVFLGNADNTQTLTVDGGNVGIGTTVPGRKLVVNGSRVTILIKNTGSAYNFNLGNTGYDDEWLRLTSDAAANYGGMGIAAGKLFGNNLIGGATAAYVDAAGVIIRNPSDINLKEKVLPLSNSLNKLMELKPVSFYWKDKARFGDQEQIGFIAQDMEKVLPQFVSQGTEYKSVNYPQITAFLTAVIQEQQTQITSLSAQMANLTLTDSGDIKIIGNDNGTYTVKSKDDSVIDRIGAFAELVSGKIRTGVIEAKKVVVDGVDILKKLNELSGKVEAQEKSIDAQQKYFDQVQQVIELQQKQIEELQKTVEELKKK